MGTSDHDPRDTPHRVSIETLYHFNCYACEKWWSVSDYEPTGEIVCPHCGAVGSDGG